MTRKVRGTFRDSHHFVAAGFLLFLLASCFPLFKNPIPPSSEPKADQRILGTWVRTTDESGSKQQLLIFQRSSG